MRKLYLLATAALAVLALGAFASSAFGLPELLPKGKWTGVNDNEAGHPLILETMKGETFYECEKATAEGEDTSDTLGVFHMDLASCKNAFFSCNTLGDSAGTILMLGEYHYVWDSLTTLGVAILLLPEHLHMECSALSLLLILGSLVCLILKPEESNVTHLFHCEQKEGLQLEKTYYDDNGNPVETELKSSKNEGEAVGFGLLLLFSVTYKEKVAFMTV